MKGKAVRVHPAQVQGYEADQGVALKLFTQRLRVCTTEDQFERDTRDTSRPTHCDLAWVNPLYMRIYEV